VENLMKCRRDATWVEKVKTFSFFSTVALLECGGPPGVAELADALDSKTKSGALKTNDLQENKAT